MRKKTLLFLFLFLINIVYAQPIINLGDTDGIEGDLPLIQLGDTTSFDIDSADIDNVCDTDNSTLFRWAGVWGCGEFNMSNFVFPICNELEPTYISFHIFVELPKL